MEAGVAGKTGEVSVAVEEDEVEEVLITLVVVEATLTVAEEDIMTVGVGVDLMVTRTIEMSLIIEVVGVGQEEVEAVFRETDMKETVLKVVGEDRIAGAPHQQN